jgi:CPA2 family monovalent cation:H+ antiporter-2
MTKVLAAAGGDAAVVFIELGAVAVVLSILARLASRLAAVAIILWSAMRWGDRLSDMLAPGNDEAVLLAVFGITLLVAGLAEQLQVSAAIGAFLVGLALSGTVQARAAALIQPLRDLFAATFFLFFSFQIPPDDLLDRLAPALLLVAVTALGKLVAGWYAARRQGARIAGRLRAGTALIARGEFSIVIAALGASLTHGEELAALAAAYVLTTAIIGPLAAKYAEVVARSRLLLRARRTDVNRLPVTQA